MFNDYFTRLLLEHCQMVSESGQVDEATLEEISRVAHYVSSNDSKYIKESELLQKGVEYLTKDFALALNGIDSSFYGMSQSEREKAVNNLWKIDREVDKALMKVLVNCSYQEIVRNIQNLLEVAFNSSFLLVQTPTPLDKATKDEIVKKLQLENKEPVIVQFQVNQSIIGGMRIFQNGEVQDMSWMGRIEKIVNLNI